VVDLATRAFSVEVKNLLVKLLNEANKKVKEAHESLEGRKLLKGKETLAFTLTSFDQQDFDDEITAEAGDLSKNTDRQRRIRKIPQRLAAEMLAESHEYNEYGEYVESSDSASALDDSDYTGENASHDSNNDSDADTVSTAEIAHGAEPLITKRLMQKIRNDYKKMPVAEQEAFDQEDMNLRMLLQLSPTHVYTLEDLEDHDILDRGLRLLFSQRVGREHRSMRLGPHILYDKLPTKVAKTIKKKMREIPDVSRFVAFMKGAGPCVFMDSFLYSS
jgi:hypothetical protein